MLLFDCAWVNDGIVWFPGSPAVVLLNALSAALPNKYRTEAAAIVLPDLRLSISSRYQCRSIVGSEP
jgi:hypothetical protein